MELRSRFVDGPSENLHKVLPLKFRRSPTCEP